MVQLFYYENRGKNFKKLMSYEGIPFRVNLFPNEDVGSALTSYWIVKIPWWSKTTAKILEVCGAHYRYVHISSQNPKTDPYTNSKILILTRSLVVLHTKPQLVKKQVFNSLVFTITIKISYETTKESQVD